LLDEVKPDVVHNHNISLLGYNLLKKKGEYLNLYAAHDYWLICQQNNLLRSCRKMRDNPSCFLCALECGRPPQFWRRLEGFARAIRDIDVLIAPSEYLRRRISRRVPIRAVTIPNFVPEPPSRTSDSGFDNFLLYVGILERRKGIAWLVEAYRELGRSTGKSLVVVGDGVLKPDVDEIVRKYNLSNVIFPLGWVKRERLYDLLADASALVVPSIWPENAPLASLEALSMGTRVVGSDQGGLPEIVTKVDSELVFSAGSKRDLARAIGYCRRNNDGLRVFC